MLSIWFLLLGFPFCSAISPKTYGPYAIQSCRFNVCRGPKASNVTTYNATVFDTTKSQKLEINMTVTTPSKLELVKIIVYTKKNCSKSRLWVYKVENVCEHAIIGPVIGPYLPLSTCVIVKGDHHIVINFSELASKFLGRKFYYGEFLFKIVLVARKGNVACLEFDSQFVKK